MNAGMQNLHADAGQPGFVGELSRNGKIASWAFQVLAALLLGQTLFFKFSAAEETVYIFSTLGAEPWGRIFAGISELVAVILLLWPRMAALGALLSVGVMFGAIGAHLGPLGIEVKGDGGLLFALAVTVLVSGTVIAFLRRNDVMRLLTQPTRFLAGRS